MKKIILSTLIISTAIISNCQSSRYEVVSKDIKGQYIRYFVWINPEYLKHDSSSVYTQICKNLYISSGIANKPNISFFVSFFTDKTQAHYKPERNEEFTRWQAAYRAEYDGSKGKLVLYPLDYDKQKIYLFSVK